jgi:tRNA threonylcarbamoyladenosine biosynthesis protein TsaE
VCIPLYSYESFSPQATFELASKLGAKLKGGEVIALEGELGAGKTQFVKGIADGLGAVGPVTSPTFTLLHLYEGRVTLAHFDVYRLPCPESFEELGYEEYFDGPGVTAVEWSDLIVPFLPSEYLLVKIKRIYEQDKGEGRLIAIHPFGDSMEALVKEMEDDDCPGD